MRKALADKFLEASEYEAKKDNKKTNKKHFDAGLSPFYLRDNLQLAHLSFSRSLHRVHQKDRKTSEHHYRPTHGVQQVGRYGGSPSVHRTTYKQV